jgi:hypothetical protein
MKQERSLKNIVSTPNEGFLNSCYSMKQNLLSYARFLLSKVPNIDNHLLIVQLIKILLLFQHLMCSHGRVHIVFFTTKEIHAIYNSCMLVTTFLRRPRPVEYPPVGHGQSPAKCFPKDDQIKRSRWHKTYCPN